MEEVLETTETEETQVNEAEEKQYTKAELDAILEKATKEMPTKEELEAFQKYKDSQKTEEQKQEEKEKQQETLRKELEQAQAKITAFENEKKLSSKGVDPEYTEFLLFQVGKLVDEKTDFGTALEKYLGENPQYTEAKAPAKIKGALPIVGSKKQLSGVEAEFFKRNPDLKPKE